MCHPSMPPAPPVPGTGACGISAGRKRRAARYENENSPKKAGLSCGIDAGSMEAGGRLCLRERQKISICRCFTTGATRTRDLRCGSAGFWQLICARLRRLDFERLLPFCCPTISLAVGVGLRTINREWPEHDAPLLPDKNQAHGYPVTRR